MLNDYLYQNLFGFKTNISDTAYVVYNLYKRKLKRSAETVARLQAQQRIGPQVELDDLAKKDEEDALLATTGKGSSQLSSSGRAADTIEHVLCPFLEAVLQMEELPILDPLALYPQAASQRASRERFLKTVYADPLPPSASSLLTAIEETNSVCADVFRMAASEEGFGAQPSSRTKQVQAQNETRTKLKDVRTAKVALEEALDALNAPLEEADDQNYRSQDVHHQQKLFALCSQLYETRLLPRITAAELVCVARSALCVRTEDAVEFAMRALSSLRRGGDDGSEKRANGDEDVFFSSLIRSLTGVSLHDAVCERLQDDSSNKTLTAFTVPNLRIIASLSVEMTPRALRQLDALFCMRHLYQALREENSTKGSSHWQLVCETADRICDSLLRDCELPDAEAWVASKLQLARQNAAGGDEGPQRTVSFSSTLGASKNMAGTPVAGTPLVSQPSFAVTECVALVEELESLCDRATTDHSVSPGAQAAQLYDALGRVNLFLRRSGLASEVKQSAGAVGAGATSRGKVLPTTLPQGVPEDVFLPHHSDAQLGFDDQHSELYARACLVYRELFEQQRVTERFDSLARMPDEEFYAECHADLLQSLFNDADEHCVVCASRAEVVKRLEQLMNVRIKLFYHNGEVRAMTVPQSMTFEEVVKRFAQFWPLIGESCDFSYMEDDDKVLMTTDGEYRDLLRMRRGQVLEGMQSLQASMSRTSSGAGSSLSMSRTLSNVTSNALKIELFADLKRGSLPRHTTTATTTTSTTTPASKKRDSLVTATTASPNPNRIAPMAVSPSSSRPQPVSNRQPNILDSLPPDMSINDYVRQLEHQQQASGGMTMNEIQRMYDRRAVAMGIALPTPTPAPPGPPLAAVSKGVPTASPPVSTAPRVVPHPQTQAGGSPVVPAPSPSVSGTPSARALFLAMGQAQRTGEPPPPVPKDGVAIRPSGATWGAPPSTGGPSPYSAGARPREGAVPNRNSRPPSSSAFGNVVMAKHSFHGDESYLRHLTSTLLRDDDSEEDEPSQSSPSWNRGNDDHVRAVMYSGGASPQGPPRHSGPLKRNAVPLPKGARGGRDVPTQRSPQR